MEGLYTPPLQYRLMLQQAASIGNSRAMHGTGAVFAECPRLNSQLGQQQRDFATLQSTLAGVAQRPVMDGQSFQGLVFLGLGFSIDRRLHHVAAWRHQRGRKADCELRLLGPLDTSRS